MMLSEDVDLVHRHWRPAERLASELFLDQCSNISTRLTSLTTGLLHRKHRSHILSNTPALVESYTMSESLGKNICIIGAGALDTPVVAEGIR